MRRLLRRWIFVVVSYPHWYHPRYYYGPDGQPEVDLVPLSTPEYAPEIVPFWRVPEMIRRGYIRR